MHNINKIKWRKEVDIISPSCRAKMDFLASTARANQLRDTRRSLRSTIISFMAREEKSSDIGRRHTEPKIHLNRSKSTRMVISLIMKCSSAIWIPHPLEISLALYIAPIVSKSICQLILNSGPCWVRNPHKNRRHKELMSFSHINYRRDHRRNRVNSTFQTLHRQNHTEKTQTGLWW